MFRGNRVTWTLNKENIRVWIEFIWLREAKSAGILSVKILGSTKCKVSLVPLCNTICQSHPGCHGYRYYCSLLGTCRFKRNSWVLATVTIINECSLWGVYWGRRNSWVLATVTIINECSLWGVYWGRRNSWVSVLWFRASYINKWKHQLDATILSVYFTAIVHATCFGCYIHPSSGASNMLIRYGITWSL